MLTRRQAISKTVTSGLFCFVLAVAAQTAYAQVSGLVSYWPGDGNANDVAGSNNGTLLNGGGYTQGMVGQAFHFDGVDDLLQAPTVGLPIGNSDRTLAMWVKVDALVTVEAFFGGYGNFGTLSQAYSLGESSTGIFITQWGSGAGGPTIQPGTWHFIAATNVGNSLTLYLDGNVVGQATVPVNTGAGTQFFSGRIPGVNGNIRRLQGSVDEIRIYNRALTAAEVQSLQAATIADGDVNGLIAAINAANARPGPDTINLASGGTYTLTQPYDNIDASGLPRITSELVINGNGSVIQRSSLPGTPNFGIMVSLFSTLTLDGVIIKNGHSVGDGGGIYNNRSQVTLRNSTVTENIANEGGGIVNLCSNLTIENSTISYNTGYGGRTGGGIFNWTFSCPSSTVSISNSTIYENQADGPPGFQGRGDAIADAFSLPGSIVVKNSIVASPTRGLGADCGFFTADSRGHNIFSDNSCGQNVASGDLLIPNLQLGSLSNNGGPTPTHALLVGSPAIDAVPEADCSNIAGLPLSRDQRGTDRPQGSRCDIGSYEFIPADTPTRYNNRVKFLEALCPNAITKTINFQNKDDGNLITNPGNDAHFETLTLLGVAFHQVQSYYDSFVYTFPASTIRVDLPPNTTAFAADLTPFYQAAGTYTITLSTGQVYELSTDGVRTSATDWDFFSVISTSAIDWVTFSYNNDYLIIDNFTIGSGCDSLPPVLLLADDETIEATSSMGATVNYFVSATDDIDGAVPVNCTPASGSTFGITTTNVHCTATDHAGHIASGSFNVTIVDTTAPAISNLPSNETAEATSASGATVSWIAPTAYDLVDGNVTVNCSRGSGGTFALGTTAVSCSAIDSHGNASSPATFTVTVTDTQAPVPKIASLPTITGECSASVDAPSSTDIYAGTVKATTNDPTNFAAQGTYTVHWTYSDGNGNSSSQSQNVTVKDATPPSISAPPALVIYTGEGATSCGSMVSDAVLGLPSVGDNCGGVTYTRSGVPIGNVFPKGSTTVTYTASDVGGNLTTATQEVTILDNTYPHITGPADINVVDNATGACGASVSPGTPTTSDNCGVASVVGNRSDGKPITDVYPVGATVITWTVTDTSGNSSSRQQNVIVSNPAPLVNITGPSSGSLFVVDTQINFTGAFTDNAGDLHTAVWTFDGTPLAGIVNETTNTVSATHAFNSPGVYMVTLSITDDCGQAVASNQVGGFDALVVVYDPNAGFVTGGGWIDSPAGAYPSNPNLVGAANFGFVSRYQKGASVPDGQTEFQFKVANLNFHSSLYEWLVVAGPRAQYKGSGKINGAGNYGFMLTAIDGEISGGGGADKFRIKIWDKNNGDAIVYDNQMGAGTDDNPTTALSRGSIVIHK